MLFTCNTDHPPVYFVATPVEQAAVCPVCHERRLRDLQEKELYAANENTQFYRDIVGEIGDLFGDAAYTADDGSIQDTVLALNVYPLVRHAVELNDAIDSPIDSRYAGQRRKRRRNPVYHVRGRRGSSGGIALAALGALAGFAYGKWNRKEGE